MDNELIKELYQSLILDHSKNPRNFGKLTCDCNNCFSSKGKNPSCGDELFLNLLIDNNKIKDVKFEGQGCALSISSASLMTQAIKGKSIEETQKMLKEFIDFIIEEKELDDEYEPLHIYGNLHNFPLRVKCVLLAWRTLENILTKKNSITNEISTENE